MYTHKRQSLEAELDLYPSELGCWGRVPRKGTEEVWSPDTEAPLPWVKPAWLFVEGSVSGVCKQLRQITAPSTTNVTFSRHRLINTAIKIDVKTTHYALLISPASQPRATPNIQIPPCNSAEFNLLLPHVTFIDTICPLLYQISLSFVFC